MPCLVERYGEMHGCSWVLLDQVKHAGLCSECASLPQYLFALLPLPDPMESDGTLRSFGLTVRDLSAHTGKAIRTVRRALDGMRDRGLAIAERTHTNAHQWYRAEAS